MSDSWTCNTCDRTLRCSCNSSECGFDYDIKAHIRGDLKKAITTALLWMDAADIVKFTDKAVKDE